MTGFVFKIQANMDPNHRDRIAFLRVCSGRLTRGMKAKLSAPARTWRSTRRSSSSPRTAQLPDEAYAGDVVGIPNHGALRIGDTLTEGEELIFRGVPSFAPGNPASRKHRRRDEGQEAARGVAADGRGRRRAALPAA